MPTVAIASEFLDAFARIPRAQQRKVRDFTEKFKADPKSAAINYEKIHAVKDPKVRTVRIDQKYRAVVLHPEHGDVYILMWVDNHDEAMAWAENRVFEVNPRTGSLQVISFDEVTRPTEPTTVPKKKAGLLAGFEDDLLLSFGVPLVLLPSVRAVEKSDELLVLTKHLPAEAAEALIWLAEGMPPEEVREAVASQSNKVIVDPSDLQASLQYPDSRRRFVTIPTDHDLTAILDAPLEKWRVFLHPSQERLVVKTFNGPARVTGGAGTGKTVVAMHRARHLATTHCTGPDDKILFTTYTANLAQNVEQNVATLCGDDKRRIEVLHLHAWAVHFMRDQGVAFDVASPDELDQFWEESLLAAEGHDFDIGFLRQEWEQVVQAHGIEAEADYLKVPRIGRGRTLSRPQRGRVWKVFENFQKALRNNGKSEWNTVIRQATRLLVEKKPKLPYRGVVVDEAQDFHADEWKLVGSLAPAGTNSLFIVGDAHQRIYGHKVALRKCGINIQGRSSKLRVNYRTTEQIWAWAMTVLHGVEFDDLDGERDDERGYKSLLSGPAPDVRRFASRTGEQEYLGGKLKELLASRSPEEVCLVARTNKMLKDDYQPMLNALGIRHTLLDRNKEGPGVRMATMHRIKGLEFPVMIMAGINSPVMPLRLPSVESDPTAKADHDERERSLLFVAATRARDLLIVTSWGTPSPFLPGEGGGK
jgi:hypothetical protein